jgi:hypothetical protein
MKKSDIIFEKIIELKPQEQEFFDGIVYGDFIKDPYIYEYKKEFAEHPVHYQLTYNFMINKPYGDPTSSADCPEEGKVISAEWPKLEAIFRRICYENGITVKRIYRAAVNLTGYDTGRPNTLYAMPHRDHKFDHKIFLMYLNEFTHGYTFLFDSEKRITEFVAPAKNKAVIINNVLHARGFTSPGEKKFLIVITFEI